MRVQANSAVRAHPATRTQLGPDRVCGGERHGAMRAGYSCRSRAASAPEPSIRPNSLAMTPSRAAPPSSARTHRTNLPLRICASGRARSQRAARRPLAQRAMTRPAAWNGCEIAAAVPMVAFARKPSPIYLCKADLAAPFTAINAAQLTASRADVAGQTWPAEPGRAKAARRADPRSRGSAGPPRGLPTGAAAHSSGVGRSVPVRTGGDSAAAPVDSAPHLPEVV